MGWRQLNSNMGREAYHSPTTYLTYQTPNLLLLLNYSSGINRGTRLAYPDKVDPPRVVRHVELSRFTFALNNSPHNSLSHLIVNFHHRAFRCFAHIGTPPAGIGVYRDFI